MPPEVPKKDFPGKSSLFGTPFESLFCRFIAFSHEIIMFFHVVFKALFLCSFLYVFEQVGTVKTIKNTAQGSKNNVCRKSKKGRSRARFGMDFGVIFEVQLATNVIFCRKNECKKTS